MAPSSLHGHSGFGIYTTRDRSEGESFLQAPDLPSIIVHDLEQHPFSHEYESADYNYQSYIRGHVMDTFNNYWWDSGVPDHVRWEGVRVQDYQLTFGTFPNHHCVLDNLDYRYPDIPYNDEVIPEHSPGRGATSYHMGRDFYSELDIPAGSEIYLNYGQCSQEKIHQSFAHHIPMTADYREAADRVLDVLWRLSYSTSSSTTSTSCPTSMTGMESFIEDLFNGILADKDSEEDDNSESSPEFVAALLPKTPEQLQQVLHGIDLWNNTVIPSNEEQESLTKTLMKRLALYVGSTPRSVEWIREHGLCLEKMVPRKSTLPDAGLGGFAQLSISKGEIVVPVPLLPIIDENALLRFNAQGEAAGLQLLTNYCYQHRVSSLVLCPTSNAGLINHCSDRTKECGPKGPNAKLQWANSTWDPSTEEWKNKTLIDLYQTNDRTLAFGIVATRDIAVGEEVFLDYQEEWEDEWLEHVRNQRRAKHQSNPSWKSVKAANEAAKIPQSLITQNLRSSYHDISDENLFTACMYYRSNADVDSRYARGLNGNWQDWTDRDILEGFSEDGSHYLKSTYHTHGDMSYWPCTVIKEMEAPRDDTDGATRYMVRIEESPFFHVTDLEWVKHSLPRILTNVSRDSIHIMKWEDRIDHLQPDAYRHTIGIPDDLWPSQWRDINEDYNLQDDDIVVII